MKFVIVLGFYAAIVFDGFHFGQTLEVEDVQPKLGQLFTALALAIDDPPNNQIEANAFNDPNITFENMTQLTDTAKRLFDRFEGYFKQANYYKNNTEGSRDSHQKVENALNVYQGAFAAGTDYPLKAKIERLKQNMSPEGRPNPFAFLFRGR